MQKLNVIINGKLTEAIKGESILELARRKGIEIPTLCHDERLEPFSSCYLCVVEVEGMKGLQPACSTKVSEGMKIQTENDKVKESRKGALDLLLSNHYADCAAPCKLTCPAGVDVQGYIAMIEKEMYREAIEIIKKTNPLPAICGRVCVRNCEVACRRNFVDDNAVGIDYLKRYAADIDLFSNDHYKPEVKPKTGKKAAVIGAGPGGLTAAYYLAIEGHDVEIFEASPFAGGMLRYGIPPYRLPNDVIDKEVNNILELGPKLNLNKKLGENLSYKELKEKFDSVILTIGSQSGTSIGCEDDDAENVLSGIDFLRNMEMTGQRYDFSGKTVAVIGGGNTAMDCCRSAMRCGAEKVYIIYRRTEKEMPANPIEIHESKLEGIEYMFLTAPAKVIKDNKGKLESLRCIKMELGEPDSSGRRRPVKIQNSEFDIKLDYILAAIGQKTVVNFIDDINNNSTQKLELTKWGDIAADKNTLQTTIKGVFAAGDGVTGPATLIEAIAQGRRAVKSSNLYMNGNFYEDDEEYEFISRRDNFILQDKEDYVNAYDHQLREEMPTIPANNRVNFNEVELGYNRQAALQETLRCLECGCTEYYTCDLKRYATKYKSEQKKYAWDFKKYNVDFRHPYIEIDNNKCILCSRCIRICSDVAGVNALGLVNRGFDTFVAPSLRESLAETNCESCGLCISTCPTAAISENFRFKPGPFLLDTIETICNYCSVGCKLKIHHKNGFVMKVTGAEGIVNKDTNICRFGKFGYNYLNRGDRIIKPLLKTEKGFEEVSYDEAFKLIKEKFSNADEKENAVFAGGRLSNEELYLAGKLSKNIIKTNNLSSFQYLNRGIDYMNISELNVPFNELEKAKKIYLIGSEINYENPVAGYMINNARIKNDAELILITDNTNNRMHNKADDTVIVNSYYYFIKALNKYYIDNNKQNDIFIKDRTTEFDLYKQNVLNENFEELIKAAGIDKEQFMEFAEKLNNEMSAVIVITEKYISSNTAAEIKNLSMLTGKIGKTSSGIIALKETLNSQGLADLGIFDTNGLYEALNNGKIKNVLILGEDPAGCAIDKEKINSMLDKIEFIVVQDNFMTETAKLADIILPASFNTELTGSYSNTQKTLLKNNQTLKSKIEMTNLKQLSELHKHFGSEVSSDTDVILSEAITKMNTGKANELIFRYTKEDNNARMFEYGCDFLIKNFEDEFRAAFNKN